MKIPGTAIYAPSIKKICLRNYDFKKNGNEKNKLKTVTLLALRLPVALLLTISLLNPANADSSTDSSDSELKSAQQYIDAGDYSFAIKKLKTMNANNPDNADILNLLGYSHRKMQKFDAALKYYTQALMADPSHRGAHEYLGELYLETRDIKKAKQHLAKLAKLCASRCEEFHDLEDAVMAYKH